MIQINAKLNIRENVPLAPLTTLGVGGAARFFVSALTESEVLAGLEFARDNDFPVLVLGGGSNLFIADGGFDGVVIHILIKGIDNDGELVTAGAGEEWDGFVAHCIALDLAGIECLSGIPGFVGGTPVQNVGAYGQEVSESILLVRVIDRTSNEILELTNSDCKFSYRKSIFNSSEKDRFVVLSVRYGLLKNGPPKIAYRELIEMFEGRIATIRDVRDAVIRIRRSKSMVTDESDVNSRSAGSFFKNPIISNLKFAELDALSVERDGITVPQFPVGAETVKVPAAWLIEKSGFSKGFKLGNAGLSKKHSLAIINLGGARSAEICDLMGKIRRAVHQRFGIMLEPEPVFVGFEQVL